MAPNHTLTRLADVEDSAEGFGIGETQEARFANTALETETTGLTHHRIHAGKRQAFAHRHENAEEVYVILAGSGRVKLDDEILDLADHDALRVAPGVMRQFEAGPDGLEMLAVGARHEGDGEITYGWWED